MAYCTRQDINDIYGARHVETLLAVDVDASVAISAAIAGAQSMIDPYLRKRYRLPLSVVPAAIKSAAIDIACWRLAPASDRMSEQIEKRAKMHLDFLKDVAAGKADLAELETLAGQGEGDDVGVGSSAENGAHFSAAERRYDRHRTTPL